MTFIPNTDSDRRAMLDVIGVSSVDELLEAIPGELRLKGALDLPGPLSELEVDNALRTLAGKSKGSHRLTSFLGAGVYDHYVPSVIGHIVGRPEFYTAYTPYQAEVSQGTLQTIFEYQSLICRLTGMDVSNASVYDGATALAEASLMCLRVKKGRGKILFSQGIHPHHRQVLKTYHSGLSTELIEVPLKGGLTDTSDIEAILGGESAALLIQSPNFLGNIEDIADLTRIAHGSGALAVISVNPISLGILKPPGAFGVDIVVGDGQALGNGLSFGGPTFGFFAAKKEYVRTMPGRIIGRTLDADGRVGYVMTLQTREQHIRREKATSNICTNQALNALAATVYLSWVGEVGLRQVASLCARKAHYARGEICRLPGYGLLFESPFFNEFAVSTPIPAGEIVRSLSGKKIVPGLDLSDFDYGLERSLLIAVTEKRSRREIDRLVQSLAQLSGGKE
jgi:glycine dehydrogenase subunit 1